MPDVLRANATLVHAVEVGIKGEVNLLVSELLTSERHITRGAEAHGVVVEIFKHFAAVQLEEKAALVLGEGELAGVGEDDASVFVATAEVVNDHAVEHARLGGFVVDEEVHAGDFAIERALGDFDFGGFLSDREHESPHLGLRHWEDIVLEEESADRNSRHEDDEGSHDAEKGNAGGFHGGELKLLAEVAEDHERCEKDGKGKGSRDHGEGGIEEKLAEDIKAQAFTYQIINHAEQELHEDDEKAYKERHNEQRSEALQHESVESFYS